ncbi:amidohydrolase [Pantoea sp. 1.19]|uniref:amidohydrolase n=1 Tax=Pantoea sp. 1.19 TaxID=1925589 RepID=UPI000948A900|nr:amidohydrolase [Pantoea sp. 1.19]
MKTLSSRVEALFPQLQSWRRDFHFYAEPGWQEYRTATLVADYLHRLGYQLALGRAVIDAYARMGLPDAAARAAQETRAREQGALADWLPHFSDGFCGVVATLDTGRPGPVLAFRVDMDALDLCEQQSDDHRPWREGFASCNPEAMHACAHDGHTAIGLGLATLLKAAETQLTGTIKLIFQPAEEGTRGAKAMVAAGVVDDVDLFVALHIGTGVPAGELVCGASHFLATEKLDVTFHGVAAHAGARPEEGRNALLAAAQAALALHTLPQHGAGSARVNVGVLQAGSGRNVVADRATLKLETRGASNAINQALGTRARAVIAAAAAMYGVRHEIREMGAAECSQPSSDWVAFIAGLAGEVEANVSVVADSARGAGSEDATCFMARVMQRGGRATYLIFGCGLAAGHHHPRFDFDERVMATAVETLTLLAHRAGDFAPEGA